MTRRSPAVIEGGSADHPGRRARRALLAACIAVAGLAACAPAPDDARTPAAESANPVPTWEPSGIPSVVIAPPEGATVDATLEGATPVDAAPVDAPAAQSSTTAEPHAQPARPPQPGPPTTAPDDARPLAVDELVNVDVVNECFAGDPGETPQALAFEFDLYAIAGVAAPSATTLTPGITYEEGCTALGPPQRTEGGVTSVCNPFAHVDPMTQDSLTPMPLWNSPAGHMRLRWRSDGTDNFTMHGAPPQGASLPEVPGYVRTGETAHFGYSLTYANPGLGSAVPVPHTMVARYLMSAGGDATPEPSQDCASVPVSVSVSTAGEYTGTIEATIGSGAPMRVRVSAWTWPGRAALDDLVAGNQRFRPAPVVSRDLTLAAGQTARLPIPVGRGAPSLVLRAEWRPPLRAPAARWGQLRRMTTYHAYNLDWRSPGPATPRGPAVPSDR